MKRQSKAIIFLLIALLSLTSLFACKNDAPKTDETKPAETETKTETKTEEKTETTEDKKEEKVENTDGPVEGGTFIVSLGKEPSQFNPCATADNAAYQIIQNTFNKLLKINGNGEIINDLAESYEYEDEGKTLIFHLHKDVKWHDGEDFSAEDVKWTFDEIMDKKGFASSSLSSVESVEVKDKDTVVFHLSQPDSGLLGYIAWMGTYIMPKHIYEGTDWLTNDANYNPIGTGPFKFVEMVEGESITLEKNPDFFGEGPYVDKLIFKIIPDGNTAYQAWLNDEIDQTLAGVPATEIEKLKKDDRFRFVPKSWPNKSYLCFNMQSGIFTDKNLREAVLYGIDREDIFKRVLKEQGTISEYFIAPEYAWAINKDVKSPERDLAKAQELIEAAGYTKDADGYYFETTIDTFPGWDDFVVVLTEQFKEMGIKLNHNSMDDPTYDEKVLERKDFDFTVLGGYMGPDISAMGIRFVTGGPMNYGNYSNPELDKEFELANIATEYEDRAVHYRRIQEILYEDLPVVYFSNKGVEYPIKNYLKGSPADEATPYTTEAEFSRVWIDPSLR